MQFATLVRRGAGLSASLALGAGALVAATPAHAQSLPTPELGYIAQAYGTYAVNSDRSLVSGPTAYTEIACTTKVGQSSRNNTAEVNLKGVGRVGATVTEAGSQAGALSRSSVSTSRTAATKLLGGAITADAISSSTRAVWTAGQFRAEQGSSLTNLRILGVKVGLNPAPNTRIDLTLPLLGKVGYVELNKQYTKVHSRGEFEAITTALQLSLLPNNPWLPKAALDVRIGNSKASLTRPASGYLTGQGFATRVTLANGVVNSGPTSLAKVSCLGGDSQNTIAGVNQRGLLKVGAASTRATGVNTQGLASSKVVQEIAGVSILDGAIKVDTLKSVAVAKRVGLGPVQLSSAGSEFVGLTVKGHSEITVKVKPNTRIDLLGLAEVTFYKVRKTASTIEVTQLEVVVTDAKIGLPVGSRIEIGRAYAGITPQN
jgi:hypothetical protein